MGLLDHVVVPVFFEEPPYCFPQWLYQFTFRQQCSQFIFFYILANTCYHTFFLMNKSSCLDVFFPQLSATPHPSLQPLTPTDTVIPCRILPVDDLLIFPSPFVMLCYSYCSVLQHSCVILASYSEVQLFWSLICLQFCLPVISVFANICITASCIFHHGSHFTLQLTGIVFTVSRRSVRERLTEKDFDSGPSIPHSVKKCSAERGPSAEIMQFNASLW